MSVNVPFSVRLSVAVKFAVGDKLRVIFVVKLALTVPFRVDVSVDVRFALIEGVAVAL